MAFEWPSNQKALCSKFNSLWVIEWTTFSLFHCRLRLFKGFDTVRVSIATKITGHSSNITYYLCFILFNSRVIVMPTTQRAGWYASNTHERSFSSARQTVYPVRGPLIANLAKKLMRCRRGSIP